LFPLLLQGFAEKVEIFFVFLCDPQRISPTSALKGPLNAEERGDTQRAAENNCLRIAEMKPVDAAADTTITGG